MSGTISLDGAGAPTPGSAPPRARLEKALRERLERVAGASARGIDWPCLVPDAAHRHEPFPLTAIQQAYWLGRNPAFELGGVGIHGYVELLCRDLDVPRLNAAWQCMIERHDMMRAVIDPDGRQRILPSVPSYEITVIDRRGSSQAELEATLDVLRARLSHEVFAPESWPLFEIVALRESDEQTRLLFSEDAIHVDLVSSALILDEWLQLYDDPRTELPPLDLSYRDYVIGLDALRHTRVYQEAAEYWRGRVETLPPPPDLPRVRVMGPPRFERMQFQLPAGSWQQLKRRAAAENLSNSALLLTVYAETLGIWSSSLRFTLNVTVFNRLPLHPQVGQVAGDFTSMALLEVDRTERASFVERAQRLQRQLWDDLEHHCVNGVDVLRDLAAKQGGTSGTALMPYVFTSSLGSAGYRGLQRLGTIEYAVTETPQVLIDQQVFEEADGLVLSWDVVPAAFPPGIAAEMFRYSSALIEQLAEDPARWRQPSTPPLLARPPAVVVPEPDGLLHEYFDERASVASYRTAIQTRAKTLTYGELAAVTNQMARRLRTAGAQPEQPIGIIAARGWRAIAAAIAAGKAGAPYLPLDPDWPPERKRQILRDASVRLVVADGASDIAGAGVQVIRFEDIANESPEALLSVQSRSNLAYVMYTSGSTGAPKGVLIEQHSVTNRMRDMVERFALGPDDAAFAVTALHHDLSVFDIFGMLAFAGGRVIVPDLDMMADPSRWHALLAEGRATVWNSVPAYVQMLLRSADSCTDAYHGLTHVMLSGDRIAPELPGAIRRLMPQARIFSLGGPTETTVWDIWHPIGEADGQRERIPYGVPLTNAAYYVMKENLEECPAGTVGELCIAGVGLARGYLNVPALTAERFVRNSRTGECLYRSGDLGRMLPTGEIDILGRLDRQVKVRGQRIELEEVEASLAAAPGVVAAAVEPATGAGAPGLVAYVVLERAGDGGGLAELGAPTVPEALECACVRRRSHRYYLPEPVARPALANLLGCLADYAAPSSMLPRHLYPSAGTQYAVKTYVHAKPERVEGLDGWYSYQQDRHALKLVSRAPLDATAHDERNRPIFVDCAFSILLVADLAAIETIYPEWGRDFALIEAGAMSQLLMLAAGPLGLGLCPIGGMDRRTVDVPLSLGGGRELLHSLCGGRVRAIESELHSGAVDTTGRAERDVRKGLHARLPAHMIPQRFVFIDRLPLTSNGKIDRRALTTYAPADPPPVRGREGTALASEILECWEAVIGRSGMGEHDRIFETGVDSFQTVRAWTEIKQRMQVDFELVEMFRNPTAATLAAYLAGDDSCAEVAAGRRRAAIRRRAREARDRSSS